MTRHTSFAVLAAAAFAATAANGCGAGQPIAAGTAPPGSTLRVGLVEWRIVTSSRAVTAGGDQITVTNTGTTGHDLHVTGPGVHAHTPTLPPGGTATLTITTRAGTTLTLTCELPGHEAAGMHTTLALRR